MDRFTKRLHETFYFKEKIYRDRIPVTHLTRSAKHNRLRQPWIPEQCFSYAFSYYFFCLSSFTLVVASTLEVKAILRKSKSTCLYRLMENCNLPSCLPYETTRVPEKEGSDRRGKSKHCFDLCFR